MVDNRAEIKEDRGVKKKATTAEPCRRCLGVAVVITACYDRMSSLRCPAV